jgi:hypothetical protein
MRRAILVAAAACLAAADLPAQAVPEGSQASKVPEAYRRTPQLRVDPFRHVMFPHWGLVISGGGIAGNNTVTFNDARALIYLADQDSLLVGDVMDALNLVPAGQGLQVDAELEGGVYLGGPLGRHLSVGLSLQGRGFGVSTVDEAAVALLRDGNAARQDFQLGDTRAVAISTQELGLHAVARFGPIGSPDGAVVSFGAGARLVKPIFYYAANTTIDSRVVVTGDSVAATVGVETFETPDVALEASLGKDLLGDFLLRVEWPTSGLALEAMVANVGNVTVDGVERRSWSYQVTTTSVKEVLDSLDSDPATDGVQFRDLTVVDPNDTIVVDLPTIVRFSASAWANRILQLDMSARLATSGQVLDYPLEVELGTTWRLLRVMPLRVGLILGGRQEVGFSAGLGIETRNMFFALAGRSVGGFVTDARGAAARLELGFFF